MRLIKLLYSLCFHLLKIGVRIISYINHRLYMKLYIPLLKKRGLQIHGIPRYIGINVKFDDCKIIEIGDRVVISDEVILLTHDYSITTALISINEPPSSDIALTRGIIIKNNVFIGKRAIIMPNSVIEDNVIIGAGSVVRGIIPEGSVVLGNPATVIANIKDQANKWKQYIGTDKMRQD